MSTRTTSAPKSARTTTDALRSALEYHSEYSDRLTASERSGSESSELIRRKRGQNRPVRRATRAHLEYSHTSERQCICHRLREAATWLTERFAQKVNLFFCLRPAFKTDFMSTSAPALGGASTSHSAWNPYAVLPQGVKRRVSSSHFAFYFAHSRFAFVGRSQGPHPQHDILPHYSIDPRCRSHRAYRREISTARSASRKGKRLAETGIGG